MDVRLGSVNLVSYLLQNAKKYASIGLLASGSSAALLMSFVRNLAIAGMMSLENYGAAATILICVSFAEMFSSLGWHQLIVQNRDGDQTRFQSCLHGPTILRGFLTALFLLVFGTQIAVILGVPDLVGAFQLLALAPLMKGFEHLDIHRLTRHNKFWSLAAFKTIPIACALLAVWPLMHVFDDYRIMLYSILVQYAAGLAVSHLLARRAYRVTFDWQISRQALSFGWPLLINNLLLFLVMQGDRVVVSRTLGLEELALFSMGLTLVMAPSSILSQSIASFFLPRLAALRGAPDRFTAMAHTTMQANLIASAALVAGAYLIGRPLVPVLLSADYAALGSLLVLLALGQALRGLTSGCATIALSQGRTVEPMVASIVRVLGLPVAWIAASRGASIAELLWIMIAWELLSFLVALAMVYTGLVRVRRVGLDGDATPAMEAASVSGQATVKA